MEKKKLNLRTIWLFPILAVFTALCYELFIFPNEFAPAGVGGIATMIQYIFKFNAGYLNLAINVPLLIAAWFLVDREFVIKTGVFTVCFSAALMVFGQFDFSRYYYHTDTGTSNILAPVAAAVVNGAIYGFAMRNHGCTGGTDVVAFCLRHYHPEYNVTWIGFTLNSVIAVISYFVYDYRFEPVICCIIYCFVMSTIANQVLRGYEAALKFEIVTDKPEEMASELLARLQHGVTVVPAEGAFTHQHKNLVICVVNKHQIADVQRLIQRYPGTFAYISSVTGTVGYFRRIK